MLLITTIALALQCNRHLFDHIGSEYGDVKTGRPGKTSWIRSHHTVPNWCGRLRSRSTSLKPCIYKKYSWLSCFCKVITGFRNILNCFLFCFVFVFVLSFCLFLFVCLLFFFVFVFVFVLFFCLFVCLFVCFCLFFFFSSSNSNPVN